MDTKTLGESRVLVQYKNDEVQNFNIVQIRKLSAELIDFIETHKQSRTAMDWEIARVYANAMTEVDGACMWAIKAICK